jgi:peptidoglycan/xylan/chitin deacetylase (PgdA/CDA1 family)
MSIAAHDETTEELFDAFGRRDHYLPEPPRPTRLGLYYSVKPLLPRPIQLAVRRSYARLQARRRFPAWPIEPALVRRQHERFAQALDRSGRNQVPFVNFWPDRRRFALILTHDVEGPAGVENIPRVLEVERRYGFVSSWNFVAEDYAIERGLFDELRAAGCEIGLHGVHHDGRLFRDRRAFGLELPAIHHYMSEWRAVGFRSPATGRNAAWMPELSCLYDSSFPDTDPFEPQPGGCCSIWPFMLGDLVELPITMAQDHTLFEILRERSIRRWVQKADWLVANHGLITVLVHPDYLIARERLDRYDELLAYLAEIPCGWHALPREVAAWWRVRTALEDGDDLALDPDAVAAYAGRVTTAYARRKEDEIVFDI